MLQPGVKTRAVNNPEPLIAITGGTMAEGPDHQKLAAFFRDLPPGARARLAAAINGPAGAEMPFRALILEPLLAAQRALGEIPQATSAIEVLLAPLAPFCVAEHLRTKARGVISGKTHEKLGHWIATTGAPDLVRELQEKLNGESEAAAKEAVVRAQDKLAQVLGDLVGKADSTKARNRLSAQLGGDEGAADLEDVIAIMRRREVLAGFASELSVGTGPLDDTLKTIKGQLDRIAIKYPDALSLALVLVRQRLPTSQSFVRLASLAVESTDGGRICETPYGRVLDLALAEIEREYLCARRHSSTADRPIFVRAVRGFGAMARALSTEVDLQADGTHARSLAALRREMAETVRGDLQDVSARVRRLVRPRAQERPFEEHEVTRLEADTDLLLLARTYAEEIALNALSGRVYSEVRELLDTSTPQLIDRLRAADEQAKSQLRGRLSAVVRISEKIFGAEYASAISKAVEVAGQEAKQAPQLRSA